MLKNEKQKHVIHMQDNSFLNTIKVKNVNTSAHRQEK